jgi:D-alanyl-lipoteichoic acid acyltransferase DltB (MBOAT superfamily)
MRKPSKVLSIYMGIGKKVVIADTCATYANAIFDNYTHMNSGP